MKNNRIRKISTTGAVTTLAGSGAASFADGTGAAASFNFPRSIAVASDGSIFVADERNHRIRNVTSTGVVTTLAGSGVAGFADGTGAAAQFSNPYGVTIATDGTIFIGDELNHRVRKITTAGVVTTVAGNGTAGNVEGLGTVAQFNRPRGVATGPNGVLYVADFNNHSLRTIIIDPPVAISPVGPIVVENAVGVALHDKNGVTDNNPGDIQTLSFTIQGGIVSLGTTGITFGGGGNGTSSFTAQGSLAAVNTALDAATFTPTPNTAGFATISFTSNDGRFTSNTASVTFAVTAANVVPPVPLEKFVLTYKGTGQENVGMPFRLPAGVTLAPDGSVYVADTGNHTIWKFEQFSTSRVAGVISGNVDGSVRDARLDTPIGIAVAANGTVYVADNQNNSIRKITTDGTVSYTRRRFGARFC